MILDDFHQFVDKVRGERRYWPDKESRALLEKIRRSVKDDEAIAVVKTGQPLWRSISP